MGEYVEKGLKGEVIIGDNYFLHGAENLNNVTFPCKIEDNSEKRNKD